MNSMDKYANFEQLNASEPTSSWRVRIAARNSSIGIIAPHGGSIEPGTSEIAFAIAGNDFDLYLFEGLKASANRDLHITSTNFDEPSGRKLISNLDAVVAIHGEQSETAVVTYVGGKDEALGTRIQSELLAAGFNVERHENPNLQGTHPENICNRGRTGRGVQLELSKGLRMQFFEALSPSGRQHPSPQLEAFVLSVRRALLE